jgi:hypothetical protein
MANKGIACGPEGDTLFSSPFIEFGRNELPILFQQVEGLHDHRLLALVTALIVEERVDKLLGAFCPRYECLTEQSEFTFSLKIRTLEALSFIPRSITDACHIIRSIRNDFAHNLERTRLSHTDKKIIRRMEALLHRVSNNLANTISSEEGISVNFKNLSFVAIVGVDAYMANLSMLREKISDSTFIHSLQEEVMRQFERKMQASRARGPKLVKKNGEKWEIQYDSFAEIVDVLPPGINPTDKT